jgi:hypothetical protein
MIQKLIAVLVILYKVSTVYGVENIAGESAKILSQNNTSSSNEQNGYSMLDSNKKRNAIIRVLAKNNSPLLSSVDTFINACQRYNLDCYLLPSIAALESTYGKNVLAGSNNPFGWGGGRIIFESWDQAINTVGSGLRSNYIDKGAGSIEQIGYIYAESPSWAYRLRGFINMFEQAENEENLTYLGYKLSL